MSKDTKNILLIGILFIFIAVIFGAFGAHGLKKIIDAKMLVTYQTGITYQFYHGFALILTGILAHLFTLDLKKPALFFILGIFLFSFNCYVYAITGIKTMALIVPLGGVSFIIGWFILGIKIYKVRND